MNSKKISELFCLFFCICMGIYLIACDSDSSTNPTPSNELKLSSSLYEMSSSSEMNSTEIQDSLSKISSSINYSSSSEYENISSSDLTFSSSNIILQSSSSVKQISSSSSELLKYSSSSKHELPKSSKGEPPLDFSFYHGADISTVQEYERFNAKFYDTQKRETDIFTLLKSYGFNAIRIRTFVSPSEKYGYAYEGCDHSAESYGDKNHILKFAKKIKEAKMAFLLDLHYSDNWADPAKQIIPTRWRHVKNSEELKDSIYHYTYDLLSALKAQNTMPDMVQIGNETTPGILIHLPTSETNCWGENLQKAPDIISGDMSTNMGKSNAAKYFKAGIKAVKDVSQKTKTVLHIESIKNKNTVNWWMKEIFEIQKVNADVMGFSAYTAYGDGTPNQWMDLFKSLTQKYPNLEFIVAEYNGGDSKGHYNFDGTRNLTHELVKSIKGFIGAFFWEPTLSGEWGAPLFDWEGPNLYANPKAFEEYKLK